MIHQGYCEEETLEEYQRRQKVDKWLNTPPTGILNMEQFTAGAAYEYKPFTIGDFDQAFAELYRPDRGRPERVELSDGTWYWRQELEASRRFSEEMTQSVLGGSRFNFPQQALEYAKSDLAVASAWNLIAQHTGGGLIPSDQA